jgi:6,7-dimethyl-8-ribityllumazine synthase
MSEIAQVQGDLDVRDARLAIVLSRFNELVGEQLLAGALGALRDHGVPERHIDVVRVPGAFEIPATLKVLAQHARHEGFIALGAVIRGDTPHFDYVAGECARGVREVAVSCGLPIAFGVLTVNTLEQALERTGATGGSNKGAEAARVALEMVDLFRKLRAAK